MYKLIALLVPIILFSNFSIAQDQWRYLPNIGYNNDTSYRIEDIYFTDTSTGYAVTLSNRIFKTTDGGTHWATINDTATALSSFRAIEFLDDNQTGIVGGLDINGRVLRTVDAGKKWSDITYKIDDTSSTGSLRICGISHVNNNFYAVGWWGSTSAKFYKSTNKGDTWTTHYINPNLATSLVDVHFISEDTGFVTGKRQLPTPPMASVILKTTDGGNTWKEAFSDTIQGGYVWKIQFVTKKHIVCAIQSTYHKDSVNMIQSYDGGDSWQMIAIGSSTGKKRITTGWIAGATQACAFATSAKGWVGGYYNGIFETLDSGKSWSYQNFGYDFNRIFVIDSNHVYAGGNKPYKYGTGINLNIAKQAYNSQVPHTLHPIYPNPHKGEVKIEFDLANETNVVLDIIHIDSKRVYTIANAHLQKGKHTYRWDGYDAPAGNYLIWFGNNEVPITQKFVLLK